MEEFINKLYNDFQRDGAEFFVRTDSWRQLSKRVSLSMTETFDSFATHLAMMYNEGGLNYEFCDSLVNMAWSDWLEPFNNEKGNSWPNDFFEVYEAFDAGEYHRSEDKSEDPVADHTNPMIQDFLTRIKTNI